MVTIEPIDFFLSVDKTPQIRLQTLIENFSLTISLGMIGGVEMQLGAL
jgi:hypothetical protein